MEHMKKFHHTDGAYEEASSHTKKVSKLHPFTDSDHIDHIAVVHLTREIMRPKLDHVLARHKHGGYSKTV